MRFIVDLACSRVRVFPVNSVERLSDLAVVLDAKTHPPFTAALSLENLEWLGHCFTTIFLLVKRYFNGGRAACGGGFSTAASTAGRRPYASHRSEGCVCDVLQRGSVVHAQ
jgi:hypothetical protein